MLIGFSFRNFTSFYDENIFTMIASADTKYRELNTVRTKYGEMLKSAFIFGANGSGKSNFVGAVDFMKTLVLAELRTQSKMMSDINNFLFSQVSKNTPSLFEVEFIADGAVYVYGFEILNGEVNKEYLHKKTKRKNPVFIRTSPDFKDITLSKEMNNVKELTQNTRRDTLFLYWANGGNNEMAMMVYRWFENIQIFDTTEAKRFSNSTTDYLEKVKDGKDNVLALLQKADINILDIEFDKEYVNNNRVIDKTKGTLPLNTKHYIYDENWAGKATISTPIAFESAGTRKLLEISAPIIKALENGNVVFIDEIDSQLHPMLVRFLVMMFNSISKNPKNAQLICNTHDILLLDEDIRRDQIYFTEKDRYGKSMLYSLTDFKGVRKESKLLKQYLLGVFGATPKLKEYLPVKSGVRE
jgi:AAA15 family ATPase/GTPase